MDVFEALYTTRAMRRVKPDPVPLEVQAQILDAAVRAPSGGNGQGWRFLLVDDPEVIKKIAPLYQDCVRQLWAIVYADRYQAALADPEAPASKTMMKMVSSVQWVADNFETIPLLLFGFIRGDTSGGSIWPALWNAQLAARAHGVGSAPTAALNFFHPDETYEILGVPKDENWQMAAMITMGYPKGTWGVASRRPAHEVSYRNQWGSETGFEINEPMWPGSN
ncbi:MAG: nitroreductase family protein [Acidimicrobiaceae bacterium]